MKPKAKQTLLSLMLMVAVTKALYRAPAVPEQTLPGCNYTCGDVKIPYPFGTGVSATPDQRPCFFEPKFNVTCNDSKLFKHKIQVLNIDPKGQIVTKFYVSKLCNNNTDGKANDPFLRTPSFTISSTENKFFTVGCDTYGYLNSFYNGDTYSTGCLTRCYGKSPELQNRKSGDGNCNGIGCCQVDVPPGMKNITVQVYEFPNSSQTMDSCNYAFISKKDSYDFSTEHLKYLPNNTFPLVVDWTVGSVACEEARSREDYACNKNSFCEDEGLDIGYRCKCHEGYEGNPYLPGGCTDINECATGNHTCISDLNCNNTIGNYTCFCPKGQSGNGTKDGGCYQRHVLTKIVIGVGAGVFALFVGISFLYLIYHKRKLMKLKEKFFRQNGGMILLRRLSTREDSSQSAQIFTADQLKKATNNYDESLIIGKGGYGTVFKGFLSDNRIVAIKKSRIVDSSQIEQFINEVVVLSQINHRNVVKLLGCCLETEVPLLVYEFVSNGTLFNFIHSENNAHNVTWKTRLRIAAEIAGALSYLHSAASIPIIHRDVKSANILLDDTYTTKVSDFGASRLIPLDQTELATLVQGTLGYLDPEYMQTSQLTEKSDVYSFGVVLVELLTGEKPLCFDRPEEKRSLAMHFLTCLKEDRVFEVLQVSIFNEDSKQEIMEVAILAAKCLRLRGEDRPTMKEVAMELDGIRLLEKHPWNNAELNLEETEYLLHEASSSSYEVGNSNSHRNTGYDSLRDHVLLTLDDGR